MFTQVLEYSYEIRVLYLSLFKFHATVLLLQYNWREMYFETAFESYCFNSVIFF